MPNVYYSKTIERILDKIDYSMLGKRVAIKIHFGERGCNTYIRPSLVKKAYDKITSLGKEAALVECNVLYKGSRVNRKEHIKTALSHGFDMPIDILDGEQGKDFIEIDGCKVGKGLKNYDSLVVLTHFKGHMAAGFGGAIKNTGMGLGSRAGKLYMHSSIKPSIEEKCIGCGVCAENCNAKAISLINGKAHIDNNKCEGCAMCIAVCKSYAVSIPWHGRTSAELQKKIAEYSAALLSQFSSPIFINVLQNLTKECDCMGIEQEPLIPDIGILYSTDIVAVEQASLDLVKKHSSGRFNNLNFSKKNKMIEFAEEFNLGTSKYELISLE